MKKPEYEELKKELLNNNLYLIKKYLNMLDPNENLGKDALDLLEEFYKYFNEHVNKDENYIEYMIFVRSYILLSHAAIEEFIEKTIKYYFELSLELYNKDEKVNSILKWFILKSEFKRELYTKEFPEIIKLLKDNYFEIINNNHGIKKHNLEVMFSKIGIDNLSYEIFEKLGEMRGNFAHQNGRSAHISLNINKPLNPQDCVKLIDDIILAIKSEIINVMETALN